MRTIIQPRCPSGRMAALLVTSLLLGLGLGACDDAGPDRHRGMGPLARHALSEQGRFGFGARVLERLPAGGYLYARVRDDTGHLHWVATLAAFAPASDRVRVWVMGRAERFHSPRLDRDFTPLLFARVSPR